MLFSVDFSSKLRKVFCVDSIWRQKSERKNWTLSFILVGSINRLENSSMRIIFSNCIQKWNQNTLLVLFKEVHTPPNNYYVNSKCNTRLILSALLLLLTFAFDYCWSIPFIFIEIVCFFGIVHLLLQLYIILMYFCFGVRKANK